MLFKILWVFPNSIWAISIALPLFWILAWIATGLIVFSPDLLGAVCWLGPLWRPSFVLHLDQVSSGSGVENRLVIQTFALFTWYGGTLFFLGQDSAFSS